MPWISLRPFFPFLPLPPFFFPKIFFPFLPFLPFLPFFFPQKVYDIVLQKYGKIKKCSRDRSRPASLVLRPTPMKVFSYTCGTLIRIFPPLGANGAFIFLHQLPLKPPKILLRGMEVFSFLQPKVAH